MFSKPIVVAELTFVVSIHNYIFELLGQLTLKPNRIMYHLVGSFIQLLGNMRERHKDIVEQSKNFTFSSLAIFAGIFKNRQYVTKALVGQKKNVSTLF